MTETQEAPSVPPIIGTVALGEVVTIAIGPEKTLYYVHKDLMCHHSEYFRAAYNGRWQEFKDGVVLDFVELEIFNIFLHWLYTQRLPETNKGFFHITGAAEDLKRKKSNMFFLIKACVFGDRFLAPQFKRNAHNLFIDLCKESAPWYEHVKFAFENLSEDDPLLAFLVDLQCIVWSPAADTDSEEITLRAQLPNSFLVRYMLRSYELWASPIAVEDMNLCSYHCHASDKEREECSQNKTQKAKAS